MIRKVIFSLFIVLLISPLVYAYDQIQSSMVKIYTVQDNASYSNPWNHDGPDSLSGSGAVISGHRIITNAHVVSNNTFIQVRAHGNAKRYEAEVTALSHETDLAILRVKDPSFYEGLIPLEIGDLPATQQPITVCGFPTGGDTLSMTAGVVSRIEHQKYVHSAVKLLAIQIDAAMNAGNSGGPALSEDDKIIGISMQGIPDADNIAYLIPSLIIKHFLKDLDDGKLDGIPTLGIVTQGIENPSFREKLKIKPDMTGCLVTKVVPGTPAVGYLQENDVLLKIGDLYIADDQTIEFKPQERTNFRYCVQQLQLGEIIELEILRNGKQHTIKIPLTTHIGKDRLVQMQWDRKPTYYIYGGLVFNPLTLNYLQCWGEEWDRDAPKDLLAYLFRNWKETKGQQVVVLNKVLPSDLNNGYHDISDEAVYSINNNRINNMQDLISRIEDDENDFIDIRMVNNRRIVLKKSEVLAYNDSILKRYKIDTDRSENLRSN